MKNFILYILGITFLTISISSCTKNDYQDSGVFQNNYSGSITDYLKTRPELFDSLTKVIKLAGLEGELNKEGVTFFAPADICIEKSVRQLNFLLHTEGRDTVLDLKQISPVVWKEYLSKYIFDGKRMLKDYPQLDTLNIGVFSGQGYISVNGDNMNIGVLYNDVESKNDQGVVQTVKYAGYRQLYISMVTGLGLSGMVHAPVATSDLKTKNGVIHVLNIRKHSFGFSTFAFANRAYSLL